MKPNKIIIIDSDNEYSRILKRAMEKAEHDIVITEDIEEGIELTQAQDVNHAYLNYELCIEKGYNIKEKIETEIEKFDKIIIWIDSLKHHIMAKYFLKKGFLLMQRPPDIKIFKQYFGED